MQIKTPDGNVNVASPGVANAGLTTGIIGTTLSVLNGGLSNILGGGCGCNQGNSISALQAELAQERAERYADMVGINTFKEAKAMSDKNDDKIQANYIELAKAVALLDKTSAIAEAVNAERLNCMAQRVASLEGLTKLVVPNSSVCPGWGNVTITPSTTTTTAG
jgi:hypothetical protein